VILRMGTSPDSHSKPTRDAFPHGWSVFSSSMMWNQGLKCLLPSFRHL
jgi:hypothetical protein